MLSLRSLWVRRAGLVGGVTLSGQLLAGCYTTAPLPTVTPASGEVVVDLTDRARVDLNGALGESPQRVMGRVLAVSDSSYTLAVGSVESLRGSVARWTGESVELRRSGIASVQARRLSRNRTMFAVLSAVGVFALAVATVSLLASGTTGEEPTLGPGGPGQGS